MKIHCFLCHEEVEVRTTRKGGPFVSCSKCKMRLFVNTPVGIQALNGLAVDGEEFSSEPPVAESEPYDPHRSKKPPPESADHQALVYEIKQLKGKVSALERGRPPAPGSGSSGEDSAMRTWLES